MKKKISVFLAAVLLLACFAGSLPVRAEEDKLPFDLVAPANVTASWMEGNDSPTTTGIAYSLSNEMTAFFKELEEARGAGTGEELLKPYGIDDISMTTQVDWAIDDVNDPVSGWHCNEYWNADNGFGYDEEGRYRVSDWDGVDFGIGNATETVNEHWIIRGVPNDDRWNGNPDTLTPGVKDQLNPGQYTYDTANEELRIDFTKHTAYFRMRFVVTTYKDTEEGVVMKYYYSDWSDVASVGRDAEKWEPVKAGEIKAPVITDLHMTDRTFNGNPVVAFTLTVPDELREKATQLEAHGGQIVVETYCRVPGDAEWTSMQNADWIIKAGEMECPLLHLVNDSRPVIAQDSPVELRCRYRIDQVELDDLYSDYSVILTFGTAEIGQGSEPVPEATTAAEETTTAAATQPAKDSCPICHFCPQPLGLCIFIWLLIVAAVIVVVILVTKKGKKDKK
nr:hypothetical protein [Lachnospiraceae bacterium]